MSTIDVLADVGILVSVIVIVLPVLYSLDVSSEAAADLLMGALAEAILGVLTGIGVEVLADVSANAFVVAMPALEFPMSTSLEEFSRCAAFDCRPLDLLDCVRVLHTWRPSYQV